ncbi:MAG: hypothetical protein JG765_286 [Cereibacter sp.]|jgi:hypothetical protein|nr:hypothetical protein [Cereibacter sp.]
MTARNCLFISTFNMDARPWSGVPFEFADVVSELETTTVLAPRDRFYDKNNQSRPPSLSDRIEAKLRRLQGKYVPRMEPVKLEEDYDVTFYTCQFIYEIEEIEQIRRWRQRSGIAVLFILETFSSTFERWKDKLRLMDSFDHVFVLNGSSMGQLARYTSTPITQLSTATDCLMTTPFASQPERGIDLCCLGRRDPKLHERLLAIVQEHGWHYHYDVWTNFEMRDSWSEVRRFNAEMIKRSRYYLSFDPGDKSALRESVARDRVLTTRYFEGAAGGAVVLGSAPDCAEYHDAFDWPDALVPLQGDPAPVLRELEADPQRVARIRRDNVANSLRKHDWAHRWKRVVDTLGLAPTLNHELRLQRLALMAAQVESFDAGQQDGGNVIPFGVAAAG